MIWLLAADRAGGGQAVHRTASQARMTVARLAPSHHHPNPWLTPQCCCATGELWMEHLSATWVEACEVLGKAAPGTAGTSGFEVVVMVKVCREVIFSTSSLLPVNTHFTFFWSRKPSP